MHAEQQRQCRQRDDEQRPATRIEPWVKLELTVPNDRSSESIVALVECVLVELTHEEIGAEYVSSKMWGPTRTQFIVADDDGETFRKRHYDERLGWHESTVTREAVRNELIARLSQLSSPTSNADFDGTADGPDRFRVKSVHALQRR